MNPKHLLFLGVAAASGIFSSIPSRGADGGLPLPAALAIPAPGPTNDAPYAPQPILPGGIVLPLYPAGSPFLKSERFREAEYYSLSKAVPGRIS